MGQTDKTTEKKFNRFSVPLGLLDYVNPIMYSVTIITVLINTFSPMGAPFNIIMLIGAVISILFGFAIPTGKVLVGLGKIKFIMPVDLVFCVNMGILLQRQEINTAISSIMSTTSIRTVRRCPD